MNYTKPEVLVAGSVLATVHEKTTNATKLGVHIDAVAALLPLK